jgi:hypothetical protein
MMATAARVTIAEVEDLVEPGQIDPDHVVTPGSSCGTSSAASMRNASRNARSAMPDPERIVNAPPVSSRRRLREPGHRMPTLVANYAPGSISSFTERMLGVGPPAR